MLLALVFSGVQLTDPHPNAVRRAKSMSQEPPSAETGYRPSSGLGRRAVSFGDTSLPGERPTTGRGILRSRDASRQPTQSQSHAVTNMSPSPSASKPPRLDTAPHVGESQAAAVASVDRGAMPRGDDVDLLSSRGEVGATAPVSRGSMSRSSDLDLFSSRRAYTAAPPAQATTDNVTPVVNASTPDAHPSALLSSRRDEKSDQDAAARLRVHELEAANRILEARARAAETRAVAAEQREASLQSELAITRDEAQRLAAHARTSTTGRDAEVVRLQEEAAGFEARLRHELEAAGRRHRQALDELEARLQAQREEAAAQRNQALAEQRASNAQATAALQEQHQAVLSAREEQHARELQHAREEQSRQAAAAADNAQNAAAVRDLLSQLQASAVDVVARQAAMTDEGEAHRALAREALEHREAALAAGEKALEEQRRELYQERTQVQGMLAKLEVEMRSQRTQLEQRAWQHSQAEARLAAQQDTLEAERNQLVEMQAREREDLQAQRNALLAERRATAADLQAQRQNLAQERAELKLQQRNFEVRERRQAAYVTEKTAELEEMSAALQRDSK